MADVYARVAAGSTVMAESRRLNALGVPPPPRRYPGGTTLPGKAEWIPQSVTLTLHNPVYFGRHRSGRSMARSSGQCPRW